MELRISVPVNMKLISIRKSLFQWSFSMLKLNQTKVIIKINPSVVMSQIEKSKNKYLLLYLCQ